VTPVLPEAVHAEPSAEPVGDELQAQPIAVSDMGPDNLAQYAFANHFDMPQDFADAMTRPLPANDGAANATNDGPADGMPANDLHTNEQNFLDSARRSAREAAEEDARGSLLNWTRPSLSEAEKKRPTHLVVLAALFLLLLAAAAILTLNQRPFVNQPVPAPKHVVSAQSSAGVPRLQVAKPITALPVLPGQEKIAPVSETAATDKILAAANGGNDVAETIIGLKNLDAGDAVAAFQWLEKAALQGQPVAEYRLGTLYERGQGVTASATLAAKWYLAAANQGNRKAMHNLAVAYAEGSTGAKDTTEAARWFAQAAALGLSDSQFNLAVLYERGDGVPQSLVDSYKWYSIAAAGGDAESKARMAVLTTQLSPANRQAAERAAQSFQPQPLDHIANVPPEPGDIAN
jgi:localization factor PodJL